MTKAWRKFLDSEVRLWHKLTLLTVMIVLAGTVESCALVPKSNSTPDQQAVRVAKLAKVADIVSRTGVVVEQVQALEIQLHTDHLISDVDHLKVQAAFSKAAAGVTVALQTLQASATTANQVTAIKALADGIGEIATAVGSLSDKHAQQLSIVIGAAKLILDAAMPLLS